MRQPRFEHRDWGSWPVCWFEVRFIIGNWDLFWGLSIFRDGVFWKLEKGLVKRILWFFFLQFFWSSGWQFVIVFARIRPEGFLGKSDPGFVRLKSSWLCLAFIQSAKFVGKSPWIYRESVRGVISVKLVMVNFEIKIALVAVRFIRLKILDSFVASWISFCIFALLLGFWSAIFSVERVIVEFQAPRIILRCSVGRVLGLSELIQA